jgi:hypothetical protein
MVTPQMNSMVHELADHELRRSWIAKSGSRRSKQMNHEVQVPD